MLMLWASSQIHHLSLISLLIRYRTLPNDARNPVEKQTFLDVFSPFLLSTYRFSLLLDKIMLDGKQCGCHGTALWSVGWYAVHTRWKRCVCPFASCRITHQREGPFILRVICRAMLRYRIGTARKMLPWLQCRWYHSQVTIIKVGLLRSAPIFYPYRLLLFVFAGRSVTRLYIQCQRNQLLTNHETWAAKSSTAIQDSATDWIALRNLCNFVDH